MSTVYLIKLTFNPSHWIKRGGYLKQNQGKGIGAHSLLFLRFGEQERRREVVKTKERREKPLTNFEMVK